MLSRSRPDPDRRPAAEDDDAVTPALERLRSELAETLDRLEDAVDDLADDGPEAGDGNDEGPRRNG